MQKVSTLYGITEIVFKNYLVLCNHFQTFLKSIRVRNQRHRSNILSAWSDRAIRNVVRNDVTSKLKNKRIHKLKQSGDF